MNRWPLPRCAVHSKRSAPLPEAPGEKTRSEVGEKERRAVVVVVVYTGLSRTGTGVTRDCEARRKWREVDELQWMTGN